MNAFTEKEASKLYSQENSAGKGFAVGDDGQTLEEAAAQEGWDIIESHGYGDSRTLVCKRDDDVMLLGDCNGAWGVLINEAALDEE